MNGWFGGTPMTSETPKCGRIGSFSHRGTMRSALTTRSAADGSESSSCRHWGIGGTNRTPGRQRDGKHLLLWGYHGDITGTWGYHMRYLLYSHGGVSKKRYDHGVRTWFSKPWDKMVCPIFRQTCGRCGWCCEHRCGNSEIRPLLCLRKNALKDSGPAGPAWLCRGYEWQLLMKTPKLARLRCFQGPEHKTAIKRPSVGLLWHTFVRQFCDSAGATSWAKRVFPQGFQVDNLNLNLTRPATFKTYRVFEVHIQENTFQNHPYHSNASANKQGSHLWEYS